MRFTKNQKIAMGAVGSLMVIIILGIVYAAFTQQLTINGSATGRSSSWRVYFSSLSNVSLTGTAKELTAPQIDSNNQTSIGNYSVTVTSPGDSVEYTFDVTNSGDYDATLTGLAKTNPSCTGTGDNASTDATNVCGKLTYTLKYADGTTVTQNDTLKSKETKTMKLKLTYETFNDASLLPQADVTISGLGITLTYTQDGNAKVNADGTTPLDPYSHHVGDQITVVGEQYYVIAGSLTTDDYVVALKANSLTATEITAAGGTLGNTYEDTNQTGGMAYHNSSNSYATSAVKSVVDSWATSKFTNSELKTVDGYSARLIKFDELLSELGYTWTISSDGRPKINSDVPSWVWSRDYWYWTMTPYNDSSSNVWRVGKYGELLDYEDAGCNYCYGSFGAVRPVINVKKSAISS